MLKSEIFDYGKRINDDGWGALERGLWLRQHAKTLNLGVHREIFWGDEAAGVVSDVEAEGLVALPGDEKWTGGSGKWKGSGMGSVHAF